MVESFLLDFLNCTLHESSKRYLDDLNYAFFTSKNKTKTTSNPPSPLASSIFLTTEGFDCFTWVIFIGYMLLRTVGMRRDREKTMENE